MNKKIASLMKSVGLPAFMLVLTLLAFSGCSLFSESFQSHSPEARQKIDDLLGQDREVAPQAQKPPATDDFDPNNPSGERSPEENIMPDRLPDMPAAGNLEHWFPSLSSLFSQDAIAVEEQPDRYIIQVPLASPDDARQVQVEVQPHHIQVSGKTGSKKQSASYSSSFLQSFQTSSEVLPSRVEQKVVAHQQSSKLMVTVYKKHPDVASSATQKSFSHQVPDSSVENPRLSSPAAQDTLEGIESKSI
jgi:hypothetical protein